MRFKCHVTEFTKALQIAARALPSTTTIPELTHFLIQIGEQKGQICATNLKTFIRTEFSCTVIEPGEVLIPGHYLLEISPNLNTSEELPVEIKVNPSNYRITIQVETLPLPLKYELPGRSSEDYPKIQSLEPEFSFPLDGAKLKEHLKIGSVCSSSNENSIQGFRGACLDLSPDKLCISSTDGNRLVVTKQKIILPIATPIRLLLALDQVSDLLKTLPEQEILFNIKDNRFEVIFMNTCFQSVFAQGNFANFTDYIPDSFPQDLQFETQTFLHHLKGLLPAAKDNANRIIMEFQNDAMSLSSYSENHGDAHRGMTIQNPYKDMTLAFNFKYIQEYLNQISSPLTHFYCENEEMPAYFWPDSNHDEFNHICVIMSLSVTR